MNARPSAGWSQKNIELLAWSDALDVDAREVAELLQKRVRRKKTR